MLAILLYITSRHVELESVQTCQASRTVKLHMKMYRKLHVEGWRLKSGVVLPHLWASQPTQKVFVVNQAIAMDVGKHAQLIDLLLAQGTLSLTHENRSEFHKWYPTVLIAVQHPE